MNKKSEGVWMMKPGVVRWTQDDIAFLERQAPLTTKKRARILAHQNGDKLHEMLIAFNVQSRNSMHSHGGSESLFVIKGEIKVEFKDGRSIVLGPHEFMRIPAGIEHCPTPLTDCVILETVLK